MPLQNLPRDLSLLAGPKDKQIQNKLAKVPGTKLLLKACPPKAGERHIPLKIVLANGEARLCVGFESYDPLQAGSVVSDLHVPLMDLCLKDLTPLERQVRVLSGAMAREAKLYVSVDHKVGYVAFALRFGHHYACMRHARISDLTPFFTASRE